MCYSKFHRCKYCSTEYPCNLPNIDCPTFNGDADANMCANCRARLEEEFSKLDEDVSLRNIDIEDLIGD